MKAEIPEPGFREVLFPAILAVFTVAVSLCLSEALVRIFKPQQRILLRPDIWCPREILGWTHCPNVSTTVNSGEGEVGFHTDGSGFRVDPAALIPQADKKILVLGDSFMEALQVEDRNTTAEQLARKLNAAGPFSVKVVNAGVADWDPNQYLLQARLELGRTRYDLGMVSVYLGNDIVPQVVERFPPRHPSLRREVSVKTFAFWGWVRDRVLYPANDFLRTRSHLFILIKNNLSNILMRMRLSGNAIPPVFFKNQADLPDWDVTALLCERIAAEFKKRGIPVVFVLVPTSYQVDAASFKRYLDSYGVAPSAVDLGQPNRILGEKLRARRLAVLDPLEKFRILTSQGHELYGHVDNHLNARGCEELAGEVALWAARFLKR